MMANNYKKTYEEDTFENRSVREFFDQSQQKFAVQVPINC